MPPGSGVCVKKIHWVKMSLFVCQKYSLIAGEIELL